MSFLLYFYNGYCICKWPLFLLISPLSFRYCLSMGQTREQKKAAIEANKLAAKASDTTTATEQVDSNDEGSLEGNNHLYGINKNDRTLEEDEYQAKLKATNDANDKAAKDKAAKDAKALQEKNDKAAKDKTAKDAKALQEKADEANTMNAEETVKATPIKRENPLKKKRVTPGSSVGNKVSKNQSVIKIYHVIPSDPQLSGVGMVITGYPERTCTEPLFKRRNPDNKKYLEDTQVFLRCFTKTDTDGAVPETKGPNNEYTVKMLVFGETSNGDLTKEDIKDFVADTFIPAVEEVGDLRPSSMPTYDETQDYHVVSSWTEIMSRKDAELLWEKAYLKDKQSVSEFFKGSKERLYSFFQKGKVTVDLALKYAISVNDLEGDDKAGLEAHLKEQATQEQKEN